jgi:hypothetical protein
LYIITDKLRKTSNREINPISAYLCPKCLAWHLTSHPDKEFQKLFKATSIISNEQIKKHKKRIEILENTINQLKKNNKELSNQLKLLKL